MIGTAHLIRTRFGHLFAARAGRGVSYGTTFHESLIAAVLFHLGGMRRGSA